MGKKGRELREQKANTAKYTFTAAQLKQRDQQLMESIREKVVADCTKKMEEEMEKQEDELDKLAQKKMKEFDEYMEAEWKKREELFSNTEPVSELMALLLSMSSRILIEHFNWKPIPREGTFDKRNKSVKFSQLLVKELEMITENDMMDIRKYCDETYELYGIRYVCENIETE